MCYCDSFDTHEFDSARVLKAPAPSPTLRHPVSQKVLKSMLELGSTNNFSNPTFSRKLVVKQIWNLIAVHRTGWHQRSFAVKNMDGEQISGRFNGQAMFSSNLFLQFVA